MSARKKGQVAIITIMLIATVLTVVLGVTFQSRVDTQITRLEEENQQALAVAEAAIEASINENANTVVGEGSLGSITGFSGGATITSLTDNEFMTGRVDRNNQYTFYLSTYNPETKALGTTSIQEAVTVCYEGFSTNPALEITLLKTGSIKRYAVDGNSRITGASTPESSCPNSAFQYSYLIPSADVGTDSQLLIVKSLFNGTRLFFSRSSDFPLQGKTATSEVVSETGVSKKVTLFQTYPQIPVDFFDTSY